MVVTTKQGQVSGISAGSCEIFFGIPYAKAPVGKLRFAPPQPAEPWEGVRVCGTPANMCMQNPPAPDWGGRPNPYWKEFYSEEKYHIAMSEDCLQVDVRVPYGHEGEKLPVAFWLHGGAFLGGTGYEKEFDGNALCDQGIICVYVGYRCNIFGFFACPELTAEYGGSGSEGILDQIAALRWTYENIAAFGGDPDNITIFGQSAGCMSVQTLVSSPVCRGLVHRAILQSGCGYRNDISRDRPQAMAEAEGQELLRMAGLTLAQLQDLPAEEVLAIGNRYMAMKGADPGALSLMFTPAIDGLTMVRGYDESVDDGTTLDIDYLLGSNESDLTCAPEDIAAGLPSPLYRSCIAWSLKQEELGRRPDYVYYFPRHLPGDDWGAFHSAELWYMFGTLGSCWRPMTEGDFDLSRRMVGYWANFMKTGDPNGAGLPEWKPCTAADPHVQVLDVSR